VSSLFPQANGQLTPQAVQITELESLVESQIYNSNNDDDNPINSGVASNARKCEMCGEAGHDLTACPDCERFFPAHY
jgi:hypothetical protein